MSKQLLKVKSKTDGAMGALLGGDLGFPFPKVGELVRGTVVSVGKSEIVVSIGGVLSGIARGHEMMDEMGSVAKVKPGDEIEGKVIDIDNEKGMVELSFRSASHQKAWNTLNDLRRSGENISVDVIGANKGGLIVKLQNIQGFLPVSQLASKNYPKVEGNKGKIFEKLQGFVGQSMMVKVIDVSESDDKLIVSEKEAEADERLTSLQKYHPGDVIDVVVKGIVDFGLFVEFGEGFEGLIHVSELSWKPVNPRDSYTIGQALSAKILTINRGRVTLSLKRLEANPWVDQLSQLSVGSVLEAPVLRHEGRGVMVEPFSGLVVYVDAKGKEIADGSTSLFTIVECVPDDARLILTPAQTESVS